MKIFKLSFILFFVERCCCIVPFRNLTYLSRTCSNNWNTTEVTGLINFCFDIFNKDFPKGYLLGDLKINIQNNTENPKRLRVKTSESISTGSTRVNQLVEINFVTRNGNITTTRNFHNSCFLQENCTIEVSFRTSNYSENESCHGTFTIQFLEPICDFDKVCNMFEDQSKIKISYNDSECKGNCKPLPNISQNQSTGRYGYLSLSSWIHPANLQTKLIFGSGYGCQFQYSIWVWPKVTVRISIHTPTTWKELQNIEFTDFVKKWKHVNVTIGKIDEPFYMSVNVQSRYYTAMDNLMLSNCDKKDEQQSCNGKQWTCSTGKCIDLQQKCDLHKDCFYGDDEADYLCGDKTVFSRCDFNQGDCGWTVSNPDAECRWSLKSVNHTSDRLDFKGNAWYLNKSDCIDDSSAELKLPLRCRENISTTCMMRLSYIVQGKASIFIEQCTADQCIELKEIIGDSKEVEWRTASITVPSVQGRFTLFIFGIFSDSNDKMKNALTVDNISFSGDCFVYDNYTNNDFHSALRRQETEKLTRKDMIPLIVSTVLGSMSSCILVLIAFTVCRRKREKKDHKNYRKISTNSTLSSTLFSVRKNDCTDTCYDNDTVTPFLSGSGGVSSISPLYDWSQINDIIHIIPRNKITVQRMIGKGAFGEVYYGLLADVARLQTPLPVAIKMLPSLCSEQSKSEFFVEAVLLSKLRHPNIVKFLGISIDENSLYLLLELMEGGDLKSFVRECRLNGDVPSKVSIYDLLNLCIDVAKGCEYLEQNRFIHRDIAARNCLLSEKGPNRVAKIADFGMTKNVFRTNYYRKNGKAMVPVKWMPPEAFHDGVFTTKTDVWGFGIILWEVFTLGRIPYPGKSNNEVMTFVAKGGRLDKPDQCSQETYSLMCNCWMNKPEDRPNFRNITEELIQIQKNSDLLKERITNEKISRDYNVAEIVQEATENINYSSDSDKVQQATANTNYNDHDDSGKFKQAKKTTSNHGKLQYTHNNSLELKRLKDDGNDGRSRTHSSSSESEGRIRTHFLPSVNEERTRTRSSSSENG
ncbi:ALK [Mytilus coruscus]|uniref:ALK n=1 Tax=Mytilus coruscus TaxID=42192 RepID=A0A6J8EJ38_MYTCO|nr:ALK [Mytilus coruscus]